MSVFRKADIFVRNEYAGCLSETDEGYEFCYDAVYLRNETASAVSLTLPLTEKPYVSKTLFPFFDGLILITQGTGYDRTLSEGCFFFRCRKFRYAPEKFFAA